MNRQTTSVSHNDATYDLSIGVWLKHRNGLPSVAILEIATADIQLPNEQNAGIYKAKKKVEYDALPGGSFSSAKKYLNSCSQRDFGLDWDELISKVKQIINDICVPLLLGGPKLSVTDRHQILAAASNGHVGAMYWIGTGLRDSKDDNCLQWLSMAHNRGHVGACYEMAVHLASRGNHIEALRCLIVSADGGCDQAFLNIFDLSILISMSKINQFSLLENMLNELAATPYSSARYLKGMLLLLQGRQPEGLDVLEDFSKSPKKQPAKEDIDIVYENQINIVGIFIDSFLADIASGTQPLDAISARGKQAGFIKFEDYDEVVTAVKKMRLAE